MVRICFWIMIAALLAQVLAAPVEMCAPALRCPPNRGHSGWSRHTRNDLHAGSECSSQLLSCASRRNRHSLHTPDLHDLMLMLLRFERTRAYSYLRQAMGSRLAARFAG